MPIEPSFDSAFNVGLAQALGLAAERRWRLPLLLRGSGDWCRAAARILLDKSGANATRNPESDVSWLWIGPDGPNTPEALSPRKAIGWLGREFSDLVFDAHSRLDPNAFGAALGAVRSGGLVLLLAPLDLSTSSHVHSRFFRRLLELLSAEPSVGLATQGGAWRLPEFTDGPVSAERPTGTDKTGHVCATADQAAAVEAVLRVVHGHRRRPLLLIADRGRGKSAAMGIAAARLLQERGANILVTAPNRAACQALFERVDEVGLGEAEASEFDGNPPGNPQGNRALLRFVAPDELLRRSPTADLLLVDEAAAIPLPMLTRLLRRYARIVFASTVHGYEGSGRGFGLRFQGLLDEHCPGWHALRLNDPIRYAADDPVEALGFRTLLLDAEPVAIGDDLSDAPDSTWKSMRESMVIEVLDRDRLVVDEPRLRQLFGLLVGAHYQTRPADLAQLLDADGLQVWGVGHEGRLLAAALVVDEGGLDAGLSEAVARGERRPPGHLLAQTLAAHAGFAEAARCRFARVQRIAVHPDLQRRGLGRRLLAAIAAEAVGRDLDFVGASFGATPGLLRFWRTQGFATVRVGVRRDAASGAHSAVLLRPLRPSAQSLYETLLQRFHRQLADWLIEPLDDLEPELVLALLGERLDAKSLSEGELDESDRRDLRAFTDGHRDFAGVQPALRRLCWARLAEVAVDMARVEVEALVLRVLQRRAEAEVVVALELSGRTELVRRLRVACRHLLELSARDG